MTTTNDLHSYIAQNGYTRGICERGKVVLTGDDIRVAIYDCGEYTISAPVATLAEAEALVRGVRRVASQLQIDSESFERHLVENDGPRGYGW